MNRHELADLATVYLGAAFVGRRKFFARSVDGPALLDAVDDISVDGPPIDGEGTYRLTATTPAGELDPAVMVWQWVDADRPTILYHHGNDERPFDFGRFATNSFHDVFVDAPGTLDANVLALRAPYHAGSTRAYADAMGDLVNFVSMLAVSVATVEHLVDVLGDESGPVIVSGISLGGWVSNLHRARFDSADVYAPLLAGAALDHLFTDTVYRKLTGPLARKSPERIRDALNFETVFDAVDADDLSPLLARHDQYAQYDRQRRCYDGHDLRTIEKGHVTSLLAPDLLREHVTSAAGLR